MIGFFIQDKEKKKAALNDRTRVPCFACIACVACFFDVSFFIPGIERVGQRSRQAQEGLLFFLNVCDHETKIFCWELCAARRRKIFLH